MTRFTNPTPKYTDESGEFMPYGLLYFFDSGTNDDKTTFADVNETIENTQPLILNGDGSVPNCFYSGSAKVILVTNAGTSTAPIDGDQQWERDPVTSGSVGAIGRDWDAVSIYDINSVVDFSGVFWVSIINNNQNNIPSSTPTAWTQFDLLKRWNINETYQSGDPVTASDGFLYTSLIVDNTGNDPTSTSGSWTLPNTLESEGALVESAGQTLTTGTPTALAFSVEEYDDDNYHDNATFNSRITIPAGVTRVILSAQVSFDANAVGYREVVITKNGGGFAGQARPIANAVTTSTIRTRMMAETAPIIVSAGNFFEVVVEQTSGGNLDVESGGSLTWFAIQRLK